MHLSGRALSAAPAGERVVPTRDQAKSEPGEVEQPNCLFSGSMRLLACSCAVLVVPGLMLAAEPGLVASWSFEEGSGTTTLDASGNNFTGTLLNGPQWTQGAPGAAGNFALAFDGADDRVDFGNPPALQITGSLTLAAWVRPESITDNGRIVTKGGTSGQRGWSLNVENFNAWAFQIAGNSTTTIAVHATNIVLNQWIHLAGVYDAAGRTLRLYTNGALAATRSDAGVPASQFNSPLNVSVGARPISQTFFDGRIDEVRVYNRALGGDEIAALLNVAPAAPTFLAEPVSQIVFAPEAAAFSAAVRGSGPLAFQWFSNNIAIAGATTPAYLLAATQTNMSGSRFTVRVTNALGQITSSNAVLTVLPPPPRVKDTRFSVDRGFFSAPFQLVISSETPGAAIRYTLDGSPPGTNQGTMYLGPVTVSNTTVVRALAYRDGYAPSDVDTQTYLFLNSILVQPNNPPGFPATWVDSSGGTVFAADYEMDPAIRNHAQYGSQLSNALVALPSLSLVMAPRDLFGVAGVYVNGGSGENASWERPASLELIYPDGQAGFQIDCGARPHTHVQRKRSFKLLFKAEYGADKLRYPVFRNAPWHGDSATDEFDRLILRAGSNDSWQSQSFQGNSARYATYTRDQMVRDSLLAAGGFGARGTFAHLYINGLYWGLYNLTERPDNWFTSEYFGGSETNWYAVNHGGPVDGDATRFSAMHSFALGNNLALLNNWNSLAQFLEVTAFVDYMIVQNYSGTGDWPNNNWYAGNRNQPPGPVRYFSWDAEDSWVRLVYDNGTTLRSSDGPWIHPGLLDSPLVQDFHRTTQLSRFWRALTNSAEFRLAWADRTYRHCFNGGALMVTNLQARWDKLNASIAASMVAESGRWGDVLNGQGVLANPFTPDHWTVARDTLRGNMVNAVSRWLSVCRTYGLYPPNDPPQFNQHGGAVPMGFSITMSGGTGTILYTLDGSDPRLPGGAASPRAQSYVGPIIVTSNVTVLARLLSANTWSALAQATWYPPQDFSKLAVSELSYHPLAFGGLDGDEFEFFEMKNLGTNALDLTGLIFTEGIECSFPVGTRLNPGGFLLLVRNTNAFASRYPGVPWSGVYGGRLANEGERVTLSTALGIRVLGIEYGDRAPWPVAADGHGFSLVPLDPIERPSSDQGRFWRASANPGGSPGTDDPEPLLPRLVINEILAASVLPQVDQIELLNTETNSVDISGWLITDEASVPHKFRVPNGTVLPPGGFVVFTEADFNAGSVLSNRFALSSSGDQIYLYGADLAGMLTGYAHGFSFGAAEEGVSFGRHVTSMGEEHFPAQAAVTPGAANTGPRVGPVVLTEIHFHPIPGGDEFVELKNITSSAVPLFDPVRPGNTWKLSGLGYDFPANLTLAPQGLLLLVATDAATFRARHNVPVSVPVLGPYTGLLQDSGELLELQRPGPPDTNGTVPFIVVDAVRYNDKAPWPIEAAGLGSSLERIANAGYGNDPANWQRGATNGGSPGLERSLPITPSIAVDRTEIVASAFVGESAGAAIFQVWNQGGSNLVFTVLNTNTFFTVTPGAGSSTGPASPSLQTVHFPPASTPGQQTGLLFVQHAGSSTADGPVLITVTLNVLPPPAPIIGVGSTSVRASASVGSDAPEQTLIIWNDGAGVLDYSLEVDAPWLSITPLSGLLLSTDLPRVHALQFHLAALPVGLHAATITITAPEARPSRRIIAVSAEVRPAPLLVAYNDLGWRTGQTSTRITMHTTTDGGGGGNGGGPLVDYVTGQPLGISLVITGGAFFGEWQADLGRLSLPGTDAYDVFNGRVDCQGFVSHGTTELVLAFSGLDPQLKYEFAFFGNRDSSVLSNRLSTVTLTGALSFVNASTPGTTLLGENDATTMAAAGDNTQAGQVIRYSEVVCGAPGTVRFTLPAATAADSTKSYLNAVLVRADPAALVPQLSLQPALAGAFILHWTGPGFVLEAAPTPAGPWLHYADQSNPQMIDPNGSAGFYRLRR